MRLRRELADRGGPPAQPFQLQLQPPASGASAGGGPGGGIMPPQQQQQQQMRTGPPGLSASQYHPPQPQQQHQQQQQAQAPPPAKAQPRFYFAEQNIEELAPEFKRQQSGPNGEWRMVYVFYLRLMGSEINCSTSSG